MMTRPLTRAELRHQLSKPLDVGTRVRVRGHLGTWTVTSIVPQSDELRAAGAGDWAYYLVHDTEHTTLYTNDLTIEAP